MIYIKYNSINKHRVKQVSPGQYSDATEFELLPVVPVYIGNIPTSMWDYIAYIIWFVVSTCFNLSEKCDRQLG